MAVTLISATNDTCAKTAGLGMETTWTLSGQTSTYTQDLITDGYKIVAAMKWQALYQYALDASSATGVAITADIAVIGSCVESITDDGYALTPGTINQGNYAICHWMYYTGISESTEAPLGLVKQTNWGESRIYNEEEWSNGGFKMSGLNIQQLGRRLDYASTGFLQGAPSPTESYNLQQYTPGGTYTMTWYQPPYANEYDVTSLRRYNGGSDDYNKVRGYCVSARNLSSANTKFGITQADVTGSNGAVTLSGATTLAAGAIIAFGTTMLAF